MALIKCGECGREVSDKAAACPQCGAPVAGPAPTPIQLPPFQPPQKKKSNVGCLTTIILLFIIFAAIGKCSQDTASSSSRASSTQPRQTAAERAAKKAAAEANCQKDLKCWGEKHAGMAAVRCQTAVEREAQYQAEWTDSWAEVKFPRFGWADQEKGTLNYFGDKVKFQNGFGAWKHMIYVCTYDPKSEVVLSVLVTPR